MIKAFQIKITRLIGCGGSVGDTVQKAVEEVQREVMSRTVAACFRKYGSDYLSKIEFVNGDYSRLIVDAETKEEVIRFSKMNINSFEDIQEIGQVCATASYTTWDGKQ